MPSTRALFFGFLQVGISGFGGVMPFAHRMLVERERWMTEREFVDVLSLSQFLPGPNIVNMSIIVGRRFGGPGGAAAAFTGLIFMPFLIIIALGAAYSAFGQLPHVRETFAGVAAGAAGLVIAMAMRMARPLRRTSWQVGIAMVAFVAIALFRWPLLGVLFGLAPVALLLAAREKPP
ncbi:MAG: chromate transporter [Betaproteobacteria bacterium]